MQACMPLGDWLRLQKIRCRTYPAEGVERENISLRPDVECEELGNLSIMKQGGSYQKCCGSKNPFVTGSAGPP